MINQVTSGVVTYIDILFIFIILAVVAALYFLFRAVIFKSLISRGKPAGYYVSRLMLPAVFVLISLLFKMNAVREALDLQPRDQLLFLVDGDTVILRPQPESFAGTLRELHQDLWPDPDEWLEEERASWEPA